MKADYRLEIARYWEVMPMADFVSWFFKGCFWGDGKSVMVSQAAVADVSSLGLKSAPHSGQNFELTGIRAWHFGQIRTTCLCARL